MFNDLQGNPTFWILVVGMVVVFICVKLFNSYHKKKFGYGARLSDKARILQCSFRPSPLSAIGTFSRMSDGMKAPAGTLTITIGTETFTTEVPLSVDIKLLIVDEKKNIIEATKQLSVRQDGIIGIIEVPFPVRPFAEEFICRAWIVAAYYKDGSMWLNNNASEYEEKNKKYIMEKVNKI